MSGMEDFDFTEEEIKEQLEKLGYFNVPGERLQEFKRDLQYLVKNEKSKDSSWSTLIDGSSTDSEVGHEPYRNRHPLDEAGNRYIPGLNGNISTTEHTKYGKENHHGVIMTKPAQGSLPTGHSIPVPSTSQDMPSHNHSHPHSHLPAHYSLYSDNEVHEREPGGLRDVIDQRTDTSTMDTSSCSERKFIKRRVLRKKDGHSQISEEITESEMGDVSSIDERLRQLDIVDDRRPFSARSAPPAMRSHDPSYSRNRPQSVAGSTCSYRLPEDYEGPKALIRPMTVDPHKRNIKKSDPVSRFQQYKQSWDSQKAPGEKQHKNLRWSVREQMLYHDEVVEKKQHKIFVPNGYKVPTDKKRKSLRWQIRMDLAQGVKPPSMFD